MEPIIQIYLDYVASTEHEQGERFKIYQAVAEKFRIKSALYPGSHIDITPSLVIPTVTYLDNFKGTIKFFQHLDLIEVYLNQAKAYQEKATVAFIGADYHTPFTIEKVDCIISQYAGFVGQITKNQLKSNGILLCNDSHGDATLAYNDPEYTFVGVLKNQGNRYTVEADNLSDYFRLPKQKQHDLVKVKKEMKGPKYLLNAEHYVFQKTPNFIFTTKKGC